MTAAFPHSSKRTIACAMALSPNLCAGSTAMNNTVPTENSPPVPMIHALTATHPHESLGEEAGLFGQLIGAWDLTCDRYMPDGTHTHSSGTWLFGWIVDGRMIQDVIYFFPAGHPDQRVGGTTLRLYDTQTKQWRVVFFAPTRNAVISLMGGAVGDQIVLLGTDVDGSALRWSFNNVRANSFDWLGEISVDGGKHWRVEQEMHLTRARTQSGL